MSVSLFILPWGVMAEDLLPLSTTDHQTVTFVDLELTGAVAPPPVQIPKPPLEVRLPAVIVEKGQWRGVQCGVTRPRFAVFHHMDKWKSFWEQGLAPYSPKLKGTPDIDFTREMVLGVFMGEMPYPYYETEIRSIKTENRPGQAGVLVVRYREIHKMTGVFTPPFKVQPFHLKRAPVFPGQVVFQRVKR